MSGPDDGGWETVSDPKEAAAALQSGADKGPVTLKGDAFLSTLDSATAAQVKAMAEGRKTLPGGGRSSPELQHLANLTAQYDPAFDMANAPARVAARKAFTSGKQGQNVMSFNTAIGHLGSLAQAAENLHNTNYPIVNSIGNAIEPNFSPDVAGRLKDFGVAKQAVIEELGRAFKGAAPDVHGSKEWEQQINAADSPEAMRHAVKTAADLLQSRIQATRDSYNASMGTTDQPLPMLNDHASEALQKFQSPDYLSKGYAALTSQDQQQQAPGAPVIGGAPPGGNPPPGGGTPPGAPPPVSPLTPTGPASAPKQELSADGSSEQITAKDKEFAAAAQKVLETPGTTPADVQALATRYGYQQLPFSMSDVQKAFDYRNKGGKGASFQAQPSIKTGPSIAGAVANSALGAGVVGAGDSATFGLLPKIIAGGNAIGDKISGDQRGFGEVYGNELTDAHTRINSLESAHPVATLAGQAAGFVGGDALVAGIPGVAKLAAKTPSLVRPLVGDAIVGGLYGGGSQDKLTDVPGGVLQGAGFSAAGGALGRGTVKAVGSALSPVATGAVKRLTDAGITLTPGQILGAGGGVLGRTAKSVEDKLTSLPLVGDAITSTRRGGIEDLNHAAISDALAPIHGSLPAGVKAGHVAIEHAQQTVSTAYDNALSAMSAIPDAQVAHDLQGVAKNVQTLSQSHREQFANYVDTHVQPYIVGRTHLDGSDLQSIKQGLDSKISNLRGQGSTPQDRELADNFAGVRDAVLDMAARTSPTASADFAAANKAYSLLSRVQAAAAKSKDGVFTPNQLRQAVTKRGYGTTTANVARGDAPMQQLATDASTILPSSVPDSGTAGRAALGVLGARLAPGAALGGAEGYREGGIGGALAGGAAGSLAFSRPGAKAFQYLAAGSRGKTANTLGALLRQNAALGGAVGSPLLLNTVANHGN